VQETDDAVNDLASLVSYTDDFVRPGVQAYNKGKIEATE